MSLIDLNMVRDLVEDINREINYKLSEKEPCTFNIDGGNYLQFNSDGLNHTLYFLNDVLWSSALEKVYENLPPEQEIVLNERENFEIHVRLLIMDKINFLKDLSI